MDFLDESSMYDSFVQYQKALLAEFEAMESDYGFQVVDAGQSVRKVFNDMQGHVRKIVEHMIPRAGQFMPVRPEIMPVPPPTEPDRSVAERLRDFLSSLLEDT
jgi:hypothetical protein